ncbi:MAG: FG-GAP-like repeat-containing protein [Phycisphaerales bacterium]
MRQGFQGIGTSIVVGAGLLALVAANPAEAGDGPQFSEISGLLGVTAFQTPSPNLQSAVIDVSPMIGAGAVGDFNNDGRPDLFVLSGGTEGDRLYMNIGTNLVDRAAEAGIAQQHIGIGCCVGDYNGDGWQDIFVISFGESKEPTDPIEDRHRLYRNNADGTFTDVADAAGLRSLDWAVPAGWGPAFGDYDLDGDLDLAIPSWTGGGTRLMQNQGDGTFENVTVAAGLETSGVQGFSARFVDMDGDRYPELLVAGDYGTSRYLRNNRDGTFTNLTNDSGTGLDGNGMGHAVADLDGDGRLDWYVTSIFTPDASTPSIPGTGNYLYRANGDHSFDVGGNNTARDGGWGWGVEAIDIDHDGNMDLVETNGWPMLNANGEPEWDNEPCYVFHNDGALNFTDVADACGLDDSGQGRGLVRFDYDRDGDQDVVVFRFNDTVRIYKNQLTERADRAWLDMRFDTSAHPRLAPDGYGASVTVTAGKRTWTSAMTGGSTFASQSELSVHLGLGRNAMVDAIRITWNDGSVTELTDVVTRQHLVIESGFSSDLDGDGSVGFMDLLSLLTQFGQPTTNADLNASGMVDADDLMILFGNWGLASG